MLAKFLVLLFLSAYWLLVTINSDVNDISTLDQISIVIIFAIVAIAQFAWLLLVAYYRRKNPKLKEQSLNLYLTAFSATNILCLYFAFLNDYTLLHPIGQFLVLLVYAIVIYAFYASLSAGWFARGIVAVTFALAVTQMFEYYRYTWPEPVEFVPSEAGKTAAAGVRIVDFAHKPNVYFISFDGLISKTMASKYLEMESLPYQDYLQQAGFMRFRNAFSDGPRTRQALSRLLAFDQDYYHELLLQEKHFDFFSGNAPSPLLQIFKANGYTTDTYYSRYYLGKHKGPYVDGYNVIRAGFDFCFSRNDGITSLFGFFGYCRFAPEGELLKTLGYAENASNKSADINLRYVNYVRDRIARRLDQGNPIFSFIHIDTPGHTSSGHDHSDPAQAAKFIDEYSTKAGGEVVDLMEMIVEFIKSKDPQAVIYVYSDHGAMLSQSYANSVMDELPAKTQEFIVQDLYGILAAIYPSEFCPEHFGDSPEFALFSTNTKVARQILRCLANGADPFVDEPQFILRPEYGTESKYAFRGSISPRYEDYLYE